jgi:predicted  nucleic acid-binding Zn-ribbon protein
MTVKEILELTDEEVKQKTQPRPKPEGLIDHQEYLGWIENQVERERIFTAKATIRLAQKEIQLGKNNLLCALARIQRLEKYIQELEQRLTKKVQKIPRNGVWQPATRVSKNPPLNEALGKSDHRNIETAPKLRGRKLQVPK